MRWRTKRGERFWAASSTSARVMFGFAVFFFFGGLAVLFDVPRTTHPLLWVLAAYAGMFGVAAVGYALGGLWDLRLIPVALALQIGASVFANWAIRTYGVLPVAPGVEQKRLVTDVLACFVLVMLGYVFFVRFIHGIARGHAALRAEVTLARRIHDSLVPVVSGRAGRAEYFGRSQASGAIGGDLVDVVDRLDGTTFYVVDVSGHGVGAGVLMAMLRSAARAALADGADLPRLLEHMNRTLCELDRPGLFATCAVLRFGYSGDARYALAGHLPILRRRASGAVEELCAGGPPLGLSATQEYASSTVEAAAGDAFVILTDGLTEVFTGDGRQLGVEGIKGAVAQADGTPSAAAERLIAHASQFGKQLDDQSVLVVRVNG